MIGMRLILVFVVTVLCAKFGFATSIDMVTVGNPGNAPDKRIMVDGTFGYGSVAYVYQIGKYEITANQYTDFLNATAKSDPNELYNPKMGDPSNGPNGPLGANIQRTGSAPNFSYSVAPDWANRPINFVSFWNAARFANWLHNGQPAGTQGPETTENGAYHDVGNAALFGRNPGARFFIPSENEWYKSAYHNRSAGLSASYFDYPTGTNELPGNDISEMTNPGNNANCFRDFNFAIGAPYFRTVVGEFELSGSPYGTFDQGGNVWEWNESAQFGSSGGLRGGSWGNLEFMQASYRTGFDLETGYSFIGFRVAGIAVPEPSSALFGPCVLVPLAAYRRRREPRKLPPWPRSSSDE